MTQTTVTITKAPSQPREPVTTGQPIRLHILRCNPADPASDPTPTPIATPPYTEANTKADEGCPLVQRQALDAGRRAGFPLVVRSVSGTGTIVTTR